MHLRDQRLYVEPRLQCGRLTHGEGRPGCTGAGRGHLVGLGAAGRIGLADDCHHDLKSQRRWRLGARRGVGTRGNPIVRMVVSTGRHCRRGVDHMAPRPAARRDEKRLYVFLETHGRRQAATTAGSGVDGSGRAAPVGACALPRVLGPARVRVTPARAGFTACVRVRRCARRISFVRPVVLRSVTYCWVDLTRQKKKQLAPTYSPGRSSALQPAQDCRPRSPESFLKSAG